MVTYDEIINGKQSQVYILTILMASGVFVLWKYMVKQCFKGIELLCCNEKTQVVSQQNVAIDSNFYSCISFVTLRQELYMVQ